MPWIARGAIACLLTLVLAGPSEAKLIRGGGSCADWVRDRAEAAKHAKDDLFYFVSASSDLRWVLGVISGLNEASESGKDVNERIDAVLVNDWMDGYCQKNPNKQMFDGAVELFIRLAK